MTHNITALDVFTDPIVVPDGIDTHTLLAEYMEAFVQGLTNRTKYLQLRGGGKLAPLNWTLRDAGGYTDAFNGIAFGRDPGDNSRVWVAVGVDKIMRSVDHGKTWVAGTGVGAAGVFYGVAYGGGVWIAVGGAASTPIIYKSTDGAAWSAQSAGGVPAGHLLAITYAAGKFVAVGSAGEIQTSPDGITWTKRTPAASHSLNAITHDGTNFVAVANNAGAGVAHTSADGVTWATHAFPGTAGGQTGVTVHNGALAAVGAKAGDSNTGVLCTSSNHGVTWTQDQELGLFPPLGCVSMAGFLVLACDSSTDTDFGPHPAILCGQPGEAFDKVPAPSNQETTLGSAGGAIFCIATDGQKCCVGGTGGTLGDSLTTA